MFLQLHQLAKRFGDTTVLEDFSLELEEGEILALLGPSGSGKTTALRLLAGFETPDRGSIQIAGEDVTTLAPARRGIGMVFQHYALFPHMSVFENVAFGLEAAGWKQERQIARVREVLELVDLADFETRPVSAISGGQQQRVAVARALAPEPRVLLLDEPLSNLDPALRERTRRELRQAVRQIGITTVLVTHEQDEAFYLGDHVAVLHRGRLEQVGQPEELYHQPQSRFVATFVGRASLLQGTLQLNQQVRLDADESTAWPGERFGEQNAGDRVELVARPENLCLSAQPEPDRLQGTVVERRFTGPLTYYTVALGMPGADASSNELPLLEVVSADIFEVRSTVYVGLKQDAPPPRIFPLT